MVCVVGVGTIPTTHTGRGLIDSMSTSGFKRLFRVLGLLVNAVVALALVGIISFFLLPRLLHWNVQVVLTGSMEPALPVGSVILVRPVDPQAVSVDDIITYRRQGSSDFVTHRVVDISGEPSALTFRTKGDANKDPDASSLPGDAVEGRVWLNIPYLGYVARYARQPWGLLLLVAVPGSLIIASEVWNIVGEVKKRKRPAAEGRGNGQGSVTFVSNRVVDPPEGEQALSLRTNRGPSGSLVSPKAAQGRPCPHIPHRGYAAEYARQPWGLLLLVAVPGSLIIASEVGNILSELKKRKRLAAKPQGDGA